MINKTIVSFLFLALLICSASFAINFSADQTVYGKNMPQMSSKLYFGDNKFRVESSVSGMTSIMITRTDKKVSWMIMPGQKMYSENKIDPKQLVATGNKMPNEKREKLGRENVNGINCDKYKVTYKDSNVSSSVYIWQSSDGIPVKTQAIDGSWTSEMKNISKGAINASLFEIPAGYSKMPSMGDGMGMPGKSMNMDDIRKMMGK